MSHRNLVPRALLPHLEAPRQVSHESQTGTRGSSGSLGCRLGLADWWQKLTRGLIYLKRPLLEILAVLSQLKMNFTIYTDPGPSPVCLKVPENSEVLKLFMNFFVRWKSCKSPVNCVFVFSTWRTGWCKQCDFKPSRSTSSDNLVDSKDKLERREVI